MACFLRASCCCVLRAPSVTAAEQTILLADDHDILIRPGTKRVLHQPTRHRLNPLISETKPWEQAIGYCSVYCNEQTGRYQLWYQSYAGHRAKDLTRRDVVCYAESDDGIHWVKPNLSHFAFNDEMETNIVLVGNGGRSVNYGAAVLFDARDPDRTRQYKMAYWDFPAPSTVEAGGNPLPGLFVAFSEDGIRWKKHSTVALLQADYGDPGKPPLAAKPNDGEFTRPAISDVIDLMYDPNRETFVIYAKTWIDGPDGSRFWKRAIVRTESKDFVQWSPPQLVMAPDDEDEGQLHGAPVFLRHGVYFSLIQNLDFGGFDKGGTGNMAGELSLSRDGFTWRRPFRKTPFLPVDGDGGSFDAGCLWTNAMPIIHGDEVRFYYGAYPSWHADINVESTGIGMATLPLDRFVGLRPVTATAQITLKLLPFNAASALSINANAVDGAVRVELLNSSGYRIPGFTKEDAIAIEGDDVRQPVRWQNKTLSELPAGRYHTRLHLDNAEVFSVVLGK